MKYPKSAPLSIILFLLGMISFIRAEETDYWNLFKTYGPGASGWFVSHQALSRTNITKKWADRLSHSFGKTVNENSILQITSGACGVALSTLARHYSDGKCGLGFNDSVKLLLAYVSAHATSEMGSLPGFGFLSKKDGSIGEGATKAGLAAVYYALFNQLGTPTETTKTD